MTIVMIVAILGLLYLVNLLLRRWWLSVVGGLFDCALRAANGSVWRLGLARYRGEVLEWYLIWHPWPRPSRVFVRGETGLAGLRDGTEQVAGLFNSRARIIDVRVLGKDPGQWELALNEGSAVGLVSWLESAPPGQAYRRNTDY